MVWIIRSLILCNVISNGIWCSRNRKQFPCLYRVIETRVEVWENEKSCGNTSRRRVFLQLFRVLPNSHECFYNSIETRRKCFLLICLLENSPRKITKNEELLIALFVIKTYILFTTQFSRHNLINQLRSRKHFPCFYRVLYNNPSYSCILIGSCLWSIRGQTHRWRQRSIQFFFHLNQSQFFAKHSNQSVRFILYRQ